MSAPRWTRAAAAGGALPALLLVAFVALAAAKVTALGVCCADDGFFASTAKNVATGLGYGTTVRGEGFRPFDPEISTGPTVILPAAAAIALVGNRYWVPGAVAIALWVLLLLAVHRALRGRAGISNLPLAAATFLVGLPLLFPFHLEQWFALLGEVPTALLLALGVALAARAELSTRSVAVASLAWGLAVATKLVAAWPCAAFFAALTARALLERRSGRDLLRLGAAAAAAFLAPLAAFELYALVSLGGVAPWRRHLAEVVAFVRTQGAPPAHGAARFTRALANDRAFAGRFGMPAWLVAAASVAAAAALLKRGGPVQRRMAPPLALGVTVGCGWFLFGSLGWPRYLVVTLILAWLLVVLVVTALPPRAAVALSLALVTALVLANRRKLPFLGTGFENGVFSRSGELESALALTAFIDSRAGEVPFASQWWATTADLEYYARSADVFRRYPLVDRRGAYYVVFKRHFKFEGDPEFDRLVAGCRPAERSFEPYAVLRCGR